MSERARHAREKTLHDFLAFFPAFALPLFERKETQTVESVLKSLGVMAEA